MRETVSAADRQVNRRYSSRSSPAPGGWGPARSYVIHYGGKVHDDGAKTEETIIQVWGMGPATSNAGREALTRSFGLTPPLALFQRDPVALGEAVERTPVDAQQLGGELLVPARLLQNT